MRSDGITNAPEQPALRPHASELDCWVTQEAVSYFSDLLPEGKAEVPKGFLTDGASIPKGFWWLTGPPNLPRYQRATLLHDYLYRNTIGTQKNADDLFLELLKLNGVSRFKRGVMWAGLRAFGWLYWRDIIA
jgi:hypothetical protein